MIRSPQVNRGGVNHQNYGRLFQFLEVKTIKSKKKNRTSEENGDL